jgi:hypothetical protein
MSALERRPYATVVLGLMLPDFREGLAMGLMSGLGQRHVELGGDSDRIPYVEAADGRRPREGTATGAGHVSQQPRVGVGSRTPARGGVNRRF